MPLKGETLKAYNNLPAIPIEQSLGDLLNTIPVGDPALEAPAGGVATLYVDVAGSDDTGDGSQANPYATPQMAIDSIPATAESGTTYIVQCGAGSFPFPNVENVPSTISIRVVGDISTPALSIPAGSVAFSNVAGKEARWTGNVGAYAEVITDGSHWIGLIRVGETIPYSGYLATASASPSLDLVARSTSIFNTRNAAVYQYSTVFTMEGQTRRVGRVAFSTQRSSSNVNFLGISFEAAAASNVVLFAKGIQFTACRMVQGSGLSLNVELQECPFARIYMDGVGSSLTVSDGGFDAAYLKLLTTFRGSEYFSAGACVLYPVYLNEGGSFLLFDTDLESAGGGAGINLFGSSPYVFLLRVTADPALATVVNCSSSGHAFIEASVSVSGSVTGNAFVLTNGAQAIGLEAACNGNLTAGGSEVVVGGNAGQTFASLPATDLGAASPQMCRAT